nr:hypothetical protein [Tanacetum cinerariifolium]
YSCDLTPVNPDGPQESSSMSSFVTSMLNPISDVGVESIFMTTSSPIVSLETPTPIMTPSTIETITTSGEAPIPPPTIPNIILENLPTFNLAFHFEERLRSLETSFSEYRQTNQFADAVSAILDIEGPFAGSNRGSKRQKEGGEQALASTPSEKATEGAGKSTTGSQSRQMSARPSAGSDQGSKRQREGGEYASASTPSETATGSAGRSTIGSQSRQMSARDAQSWISDLARQTDVRSSFNELLDTPIDFSNFIMHRLNVDTLTPKLLAGLTYELIRGSCNSLTELEYHLEEPLPLVPDNRGCRVIPFEHFINNNLEYLWGVNRESALVVYSKRRIIAVTELKIVEWHDYKHLDWIS